ncbi:hypothetical protein CaCOL14_002161 [Colletotrichum acutatum]
MPLLHLETPRKSIRPLKQMLQPAESANKPSNHTLSRFPNCLFPVTHTPSEGSPLFELAIHKGAIEVFGHSHAPQIAMLFVMAVCTIAHLNHGTSQEHQLYDIAIRGILSHLDGYCGKYKARRSSAGVPSQFAEEFS